MSARTPGDRTPFPCPPLQTLPGPTGPLRTRLMSLLRQLREAGLWDSSFCGFCIVSCIFEPEARFTLLRRHTIFTLALFIAGTIAAYGYGFRTAQKQLWPYRQLESFIEFRTNAPVKFDTYGRLNASITIAGIELAHRISKGQFALKRLRVRGKTAPEIWTKVLAA